jgi:hypothetical protein
MTATLSMAKRVKPSKLDRQSLSSGTRSRKCHSYKNCLLLALLCGLTYCGSAVFASAQAVSLPAPSHQNTFSNAFVPNLTTFPRISNGFLWSVRRELTKPEPDALVLDPLEGGPRQSISFWIPGASEIWVEDVAIAQDHSIIVVGSLSRPDDQVQHSYLSRLDFQGRVLSTVTLGAYEPEKVCSTDDGTLWMVGQSLADEMQGISYTMLRNYSIDGKLLHEYLNRKDLPVQDLNLSARLAKQGSDHARLFLACGAGVVGTYIGPGHTWAQVHLSDYSARFWWVKPPAKDTRSKGTMRVTGLALLDEGNIYASFTPSDDQRFPPQWSLYKLDVGQGHTGTWIPAVPEGTADVGSQTIIGSDGANIVFSRRLDLPSDTHVLLWTKP